MFNFNKLITSLEGKPLPPIRQKSVLSSQKSAEIFMQYALARTEVKFQAGMQTA